MAATLRSTGEQPSNPAELSLLQAAAALERRQLSALELTEACLQRIEERNGGPPSFDGAPGAINAWARIYPELAREQARSADRRRAAEREAAPLLCGIPLALKDLYAVAGLPLTASSRVLEGNVAARDAVVWARLRAVGVVLLGHTHTHEFAAGGTTDQVGNPWALELTAGGSSGGSAAALAARMVPAALGSDTCGSLRIPSACCGTAAIKPTHGRLPLAGIIPLAPSLDHPGPMARTVADCAALLEAMAAGGEEATPLSPPAAPLGALPRAPRPGPRPLAGLRIALTERPERAGLEPVVAECFERAQRACERLGAELLERRSPAALDWDDLAAVLRAEAWHYHRRHAEQRERYRPAIAEYVEAAAAFDDVQAYVGAQLQRVRLTRAWERWFAEERIDLLLEPTLPIPPGRRGSGYERGHAGGPGDPMIALTALWDLTGMPVASLPVSCQVGVSLVAPRGREAALAQAGIDLQEHALGVPAYPRRA
jgi:aspartyl-tRNA(Asn)/glutamyl-tRNA(Gln) amidotransferase subunit A